MADEATKMRAAIINSFLDVPQPFHGSFGVITQPSEREIYSAQIIPMEQLASIHDFPDVDECIHKKRHEEANNIDDVRLGEYYIHVYGKKKKENIELCKERPDGAGSFDNEEGEEQLAKPCNLCKTLQNTLTPCTTEMEIKCFST